jgi:glycosyltransferase involved in cell wall biosynthesis
MKDKVLVVSFQSLTATGGAGMAGLGYAIAQRLQQKGRLKYFIISSKGKFDTPFPSFPVSIFSRYYLFLINSFTSIFGIPVYKSRFAQEEIYDFFCQFHLDSSISTLVTTTPYLYRTFKKAKRLGIEIVIIPGNPEENFIHQLITEENEKYGIVNDDPYTYQPRLNHYNKALPLADHIIAYSKLIEKTYLKKVNCEIVSCVPGLLKPEFPKSPLSITRTKFKVAFLAHTVLLKGLQYLMEAWSGLQNYPIELHIGGVIDKNVADIISTEYSHLAKVYFHNQVTDKAAFFSDKSLFVSPSIIDGWPLTVAEAMYYSVPVIVSDGCGIKDMVEEGKSGWIVPNRDAKAIGERILEAFEHQERTAEMGRYAHQVLVAYDKEPFIRDIASLVIGEGCKQMVNER